MSNSKQNHFEYVLHCLLLWYKEVKGNEEGNDISTLKALKLLFFVSAAKSSSEAESLVDDPFNSFVAMPYGHVELDVYNLIQFNGGTLEYFKINNSGTTRLKEDLSPLISSLNMGFKKKIDESVDFLKLTNNELILASPFDLVELSHLWFSWKKNYNIARSQSSRRQDIPAEDIKSETKVYTLQSFI